MVGCEASVGQPDVLDLRAGLAQAGDWEVFAPDGITVAGPGPGRPGGPRPRIVVGHPEQGLAAQLAGHLELKADGEGAEGGLLLSSMSNFAILARFADPDRPGLPLLLCVAADPAQAAALVHPEGIGWQPSADLYQSGDLLGHFRLEPDGSPRKESWVMFAVSRPARIRDAARREGGGFVLTADPAISVDRLDFYADSLGEVLAHVGAWADPARTAPDLALEIDGDLVFLAGQGAGADLWRINPVTGAVQTALVPGVADDGGRGAAHARLRATLGAASHAWMEDGAAVDAAGSWWGRDLEEWVAFLAMGDLVPPLEDLLDPTAHLALSPHRLLPVRGALFRALRERDGADVTRARYGGTDELPPENELQDLLAAWTERVLTQHRSTLTARRLANRELLAAAIAPGGDLFQGVGWIPPGGNWVDPDLAADLARARDAGADSFTLRVTFTRVFDPWPGLPAGTRQRLGTREGDALVAGAIAAGRGGGLAPILLLEVLTAPSGNRSGERKRTSVAEWDEFFADYTEAVLHAGLLAELNGCRILCIGEGMPAATRVEPVEGTRDDPALLARRRTGWETLIPRARAAFTGGLTFGARWPMQVNNFPFWEQLDLVGVELLAPLRDPKNPDGEPGDGLLTARLRGALVESAQLAASLGKTALVIEAGFAATSHTWEAPGLGMGAPDPAEQARLYRALDRALAQAIERTDHLAGLTLWAWPPASAGEGGEGPVASSDLWRPSGGASLQALPSILGR
jgi:hypothetical protein